MLSILQMFDVDNAVCFCTRVSYKNLFAQERRDLVITLSVPEGVSSIMNVQVDYTDAATVQRVSKQNIGVSIDRSATEAVLVTVVPVQIVRVTIVKFVTVDVSIREFTVHF